MASINPWTLSIAAGDYINYKGESYRITSVGTPTDNDHGTLTYPVTISTGDVINVTYGGCVLSQETYNGQKKWVQSNNA